MIEFGLLFGRCVVFFVHEEVCRVHQCAHTDFHRSIKIKKDNGKLKLYVNLNVYCKISDTDDKTYNGSYSDYTALPKKVKDQAEINLKKDIEKLLKVSSNTECDVLKLDDRIYKYHNSFYSKYKENPAKLLDYEITVTVNSQK